MRIAQYGQITLDVDGLENDFSPLTLTTRCLQCGATIARTRFTVEDWDIAEATITRIAEADATAATSHICTHAQQKRRET